MSRRSWSLASAFAVLLAQPLALASGATTDDAFSPQVVFALPDRTNIDSRCSNARTFADTAAKGTDSISPDDAIAAANQFAACFRLPKINPDVDRQRYLMLAGAAALYLAATKTTGDESLALYKKADSIAAILGASQPDRTNGIKTVVIDPTKATGTSASPDEQMNTMANESAHQNPGMNQSGYTTYNDQRNPHMNGQRLKFTELATQLRASAAPHLEIPATPKPAV